MVPLILGVGLGLLLAASGVAAIRYRRRVARSIERMRHDFEARLEAAEQEQATRGAILAALDEGVILFDPSGTVRFRNQRVDQMLGARAGGAPNLLPQEIRDMVDGTRNESAGPASAMVTTRVDRTLRATAVPIGSGHVLLILRDVTGDRRVEAIRREFVANASHELKTPVASIRALAETISASSGRDPAATGRFVAQLEQEAVRLSRIVSDLLDLSRLETQTGEKVAVRFDEIVSEEVRRLERTAGDAGISLSLGKVEAAEVLGSASDLALLIRNLVENATQNTRRGGSVEVTLSVENSQAVLTVRDTGVGIPARDRSRVFERFYRVDRARSRETGGTGLGLSIVKHVAENHGGTVHLESELGTGSAFVVRIPIARDLQKVP